ncbi:MAG: hypothetical protein WDN26_03020 [Chitinophagaceae bacterium]
MKTIRIVQTAMVAVIAVSLVSCSSGRNYQTYPPRSSVSLIIDAGPGMMINRYNDGRYYYRAPNGYTYWRGYNNRYYLDQRYIRPYSHHNQYNDWRRYHRRR